MGTSAFQAAFARREPLAEVTVFFREGIDDNAATATINALAEDFDLYPKPWYNNSRLRVGSATKAALERLFGMRIKRVLLPNQTRFYWWEIECDATKYPPGIENLIQSIGLSQPGADDDGQPYDFSNIQ